MLEVFAVVEVIFELTLVFVDVFMVMVMVVILVEIQVVVTGIDLIVLQF